MASRLRQFIQVLLLLILGVMTELSAQSPTPESAPQQALSQEENNLTSDQSKQNETDPWVTSLVDGLFGMRNRMGVAVSLTEFYTPDILIDGSKRQSGSFTSAGSSIYGNFHRPKSQFHFDYNLGYRRDNRQLDLSGITHSGSLNWSRTIGRRGSLSVTDSVVAAANDYGGSTPQSVYQVLDPYVLTHEIFVDRQKITRNVLSANAGYQLGRHTSVAVFASHELTRYQRADYRHTQTFQVGFSASHQLTKSLSIQTSYTSFLNKVNPIYRGASIQRLRAPTLQFRKRRFGAFVSGGIQFANNPGSNDIVADAEAGMSAGSRSTQFSARYNHGLTSIIGPGAAIESDTVNLSLRHRLSNRVFVGLNSFYMRHGARVTGQTSEFRSLATGAGVQLALTTGVVLSVSHNYISQRARNTVFDVPRLHRYASSASIHYVLPPLRVR